MKTPSTHQDWLTDVQDAYFSACERFRSGFSDISSITELFKISAAVAAERRGIAGSAQVRHMSNYVIPLVESDLANGGDLSDYKFHFVISYIHAHTPMGIVDELQADKIMEYVNDHWDLFDEHA